ncbi:superoxide dismutase [Aggregatimonas sangjinii]|uniref:Superoxide dismutase n=1 Tax=Aggregatimonas sangjinii TaxID=2583587 RepID=A0A5B7SMW9_9FLAO|nr:superoxide dismutase [Aggregatimonas sangjinii]QCW99481.1 superoxide dismutase [Aggregatimonas sangjinii]
MYTLPELQFTYDELEPYIDAETMRIHHTKHHQGYTDKLNNALKEGGWENENLEDILRNISKYNTAVRNNGGGFYNHSLFWNILAPDKTEIPEGEFKNAFYETFGTMENFIGHFGDAAKSRFGSGWAWLSVEDSGKLFISSTANQDNPLMDSEEQNGTPILGLDVWEHAYYLNYQNRRPDYVSAFFEMIDWSTVAKNYMNTK